MSNQYVPVVWNKQKKRYDRVLWLGILLLIVSFIGIHLILDPQITPETLIIRTTSLVAVVLLHFILMIGPVARLNSAYLPLLYNRRHMGVSMFLFAAIHAVFSIIQFHSLGDVNPFLSIFVSNEKYLTISQFPFQVLGFFALVIFFLMAATSHDFWLKNLSPKVWKTLHMLVYVAYALVMLHVALGILQYESKPIYWSLWLFGFVMISSLHLIAGLKTKKEDRAAASHLQEEGFVQVAKFDNIPVDRAKIVLAKERNIAIFRYDGKVSAVDNVCRHQMGPLGEGKIVDGCITCPWHGYQYLPQNGQSPPPFTEKLETYETKILDGMVWVNPNPNPEGTYVEPATCRP
ncbi:MAG: ferric reductase-like transmembrane domain-containing protein [Bacteroidota bacterium]